MSAKSRVRKAGHRAIKELGVDQPDSEIFRLFVYIRALEQENKCLQRRIDVFSPMRQVAA